MNSLNLINGYGSDSSDSSVAEEKTQADLDDPEVKNFFTAEDVSSSGEEDDDSCEKPAVLPAENLLNPFRATNTASSTLKEKPSVFANPFKEAEDAVKCALEQHVKFAPRIEDIKEINGRKICWNYRKGRCRFGTECVFAHDCELLNKKSPATYDTSKEPEDSSVTISSPINETRKSMKRPGLSQGIVPGKKVLKKYHEQKGKH